MIAYKINREHKTFEVLAFYGIEDTAFLKQRILEEGGYGA